MNGKSLSVEGQTNQDFGFLRSLMGRLFGGGLAPLSPVSRHAEFRPGDSSGDLSWTVSLSRGENLPPFRLCILAGAGARASVRFEPLAIESPDELA